MALLTPQQIGLAGTVVTYAAATASTGDTFLADGHTWIEVNNASGGSINATVTVARKGPGQTTIGPLVVAVAAAAIKRIGPFSADDFNDPTALVATVVCSSVTSVTIAAVRGG